VVWGGGGGGRIGKCGCWWGCSTMQGVQQLPSKEESDSEQPPLASAPPAPARHAADTRTHQPAAAAIATVRGTHGIDNVDEVAHVPVPA